MGSFVLWVSLPHNHCNPEEVLRELSFLNTAKATISAVNCLLFTDCPQALNETVLGKHQTPLSVKIRWLVLSFSDYWMSTKLIPPVQNDTTIDPVEDPMSLVHSNYRQNRQRARLDLNL